MNEEFLKYDIICKILNDTVKDAKKIAPRTGKKFFYHYTSIAGFLLMMKDIRDKKCYLFPGNTQYQNDANELFEGEKFIGAYIEQKNTRDQTKQLLEKSLNHFSKNVYIACFSSDRDMLEQWKYYGKNCGLSIGFDFNECEGFWKKDAKISDDEVYTRKVEIDTDAITSLITNDDELDFSDADIPMTISYSQKTRKGNNLRPIEVLYTDDEKRKALEYIIKGYDNDIKKLGLIDSDKSKEIYYNNIIASFIPICKNNYFAHEKESRLLFFPTNDTPMLYREKGSRILPYFKCTIVNKDKDKLPIKSVTVGPGANQNLVFNAVINMIEGTESGRFYSETICEKKLEEDPWKIEDISVLENDYPERLFCTTKISEDNIEEKILVYRSVNGVLIYKSTIPFRD